jgi:glutathione-regulated potassium-efflux system ancillary protein KefG
MDRYQHAELYRQWLMHPFDESLMMSSLTAKGAADGNGE